MFSEPYRYVKHFGLWAEESADRYGTRDALELLATALERCGDEDMRTSDTMAALEFLAYNKPRLHPFADFRAALTIQHPEERYQRLQRALYAIRRQCGFDC